LKPTSDDSHPEGGPPKPEQVVTTGLLVLLGAPGLYLLWQSLPWPLVHDAPILHYIAWRIGEGAVPYRDLFDMNQPGVYVFHRAVLALVGEGDFAWRLVDLGWLAAAALLIRAFAAPWGPVAGWGGALAFAVYHLAGGAWQAGQRDFLLCPLLLAAALGVARWVEAPEPARPWTVGVAGLALGAAITIKPHAALLAAALGVVLALAGQPRGATRPLALATYAAAVVVPPAGAFVWLAARGALGAWRAIVFDYLVPLYSPLTRHADWGLYRWQHWVPVAAAVGVSLASTCLARRLTVRHGVAVLGLGYGLVHFFGQRKGWEYHLYPLAAFASVLLFSEIERLVRERRLALGVPLAASLAAVAVLLSVKGVESVDAAWIWDKERGVRLLVADLGERLEPGDTVQVLDTTEGGIHALLRLKRREPTRFLYDFHFFHDAEAPVIRQLRAELVRDMAERPPRFVVVFARGWPAGGYERVERLPEIARQLETAYAVVLRRPAYVIFAKRDHP
jgi:hypothetical protein